MSMSGDYPVEEGKVVMKRLLRVLSQPISWDLDLCGVLTFGMEKLLYCY